MNYLGEMNREIKQMSDAQLELEIRSATITANHSEEWCSRSGAKKVCKWLEKLEKERNRRSEKAA